MSASAPASAPAPMAPCTNQDSFNNSLYKGLKFVRDKEEEEMKQKAKDHSTQVMIVGIIWLILAIWAIKLAMDSPGPTRTIDIVFAFLFGPLYVISHYLGKLSPKFSM